VSRGVPVQLESVDRTFGRVRALEDVSFDLQPGEVVGLLGPNGAGKTTTMRVITGYLRPDNGVVRVGDVDVKRDPVAAQRLIGYLPESAPVPRELTVRGYLSYCAKLRLLPRPKRRAAVAGAVDKAGLDSVVDQVIGTLSKGYRQRVGLAQALVHDPPVLILDEPTAGLDPRQVAETRSLIARLGRQRTVLFSSHLLAEVSALCRRVVILDRGRVVATRDVAELARAAGAVHFELRLTGDLVRAARLLAPLEGVESAVAGGDRIVVRGSGDDLGQRISAAVVRAGFGLIELRVEGGNLEDAYLRLVHE
jgi:ABC-2 type transport system ATP-binding protein